MWGWIGANSNGNLTTGVGFRLGGGGQRDDDGCASQVLGCLAAALWLVAILVVLWLVVAFVREML